MAQQQFAAGDARGHQKSARLDAVGHDGVFRAVQAAYALYAETARALALDARAAGQQKVGQIHHFRFAGRVFQNAFRLRPGRRP